MAGVEVSCVHCLNFKHQSQTPQGFDQIFACRKLTGLRAVKNIGVVGVGVRLDLRSSALGCTPAHQVCGF